MPRLSSLLFTAAALLPLAAHASATLTDTELRWLRAGAPVLAFARQIGLPVDIVVQPQAAPGDVPLAMGFDGARCKLVLSMRGNDQAEAILQALPTPQQGVLIESMTAHELGHCWRYAQGSWHALPAGFVEVGQQSAADPGLLAAAKAMREARREEGFSDLAALAWVQERHPADYAAVYAWMEGVRRAQTLPGSSHDTLVWLREAQRGDAFAAGGSVFERALPLWGKGLTDDSP